MKEKGNRQDIVLATKVRGRMWQGPNGEGLSRIHIMRAVEESLQRLQTDYIDLYQTHSPDLNTPLEETMRAFDDLIKQGKVRYAGCSNYNGWQLMEALLVAKHAGLNTYVSIQPHWSLVEREKFERDVYPVVKKFNLGIIPYSPLGRGFLSGKYRRGQPLPESKRTGSVQPLLTDKNFNLLDKIEEIGKMRGKSASQISLAWLLTKPHVASPIIGANNIEQLNDSLGATGLKLTDEEMNMLDMISEWKK
jgi:aryl-alcohol dehydrogenase-like predicted oxidoreductase